MKIAQVVCVYPPYRGGIGKSAFDNTLYFQSRGHEVTVFTPLPDPSLRSDQPNIVYLPSWLASGKGALMPGLIKSLSAFDLVYLHYPFFGSAEMVYLAKFFPKNKFKLLLHYHMDTPALPFPKNVLSWPDACIRKPLFARADAILCASLDYIASGPIASIYEAMPEKFHELPFKVDSDYFSPIEKTDTNALNILFVGGMDKAHYFKGVEILIDAYAKMATPNISLSLFGDGDLLPVYKERCQKHGIAERVHFLGSLDDEGLRQAYREADIFVLPSINRHEAFGIVLLEAMSSGVPVLASRLPGVRKVFTEGEQGLYFEPGNESDLLEKLKILATDKQKRMAMSLSARKLAVEKYSLKAEADKLNNLILSLKG
jgi:glycosyltransferase involved in cell wall biosynthesis